jgi:hypothetical protein
MYSSEHQRSSANVDREDRPLIALSVSAAVL